MFIAAINCLVGLGSFELRKQKVPRIFIKKCLYIFFDTVYPLILFGFTMVGFLRLPIQENFLSELLTRSRCYFNIILLLTVAILSHRKKKDLADYYQMIDNMKNDLYGLPSQNDATERNWLLNLMRIIELVMVGIIIIIDTQMLFIHEMKWYSKFAFYYTAALSICITYLICDRYQELTNLYKKVNKNIEILHLANANKRNKFLKSFFPNVAKKLLMLTNKHQAFLMLITFAVFLECSSTITFTIYNDFLFNSDYRDPSESKGYVTCSIWLAMYLLQISMLIGSSVTTKAQISKLRNNFYKMNFLNGGEQFRSQSITLMIMYKDMDHFDKIFDHIELDGSLLVHIISSVLSYSIILLQLRYQGI